MKEMTLEALENYMASQECVDMFGDDEESAEKYFWENMDDMVDMYA